MPFTFPRCEVVPLPDHQASFRIDGAERLRWHFGPSYPRPFFYPLVGPSGTPLTRMGHPGDPGHDHHRSVWFARHDPKALLDQELVVAVRPGPDGETFVELQATFRPTAETLEFGKTNFGFLAVRVAKHLSAHFGGGTIANSAGADGEAGHLSTPG